MVNKTNIEKRDETVNDLNVSLNAFGGDTMSILATRAATSRFSVWGDVGCSRKVKKVVLPDDPQLVSAIEYESVGYEDDGRVSSRAAFVTTGFETAALIRVSDDYVGVTVWGKSSSDVDKTVKAFLAQWPPMAGSASSDDEPMVGLYL